MANGWTSERRARQAALIRSWRPWKRSTGPRTPEGKAKVARNAYKGGTRLLLRELRRAMAEQQSALARLKGVRDAVIARGLQVHRHVDALQSHLEFPAVVEDPDGVAVSS
jgi:hypothetical protein